MKTATKTSPKPKRLGQLKVDRDLSERINEAARNRGMTTIGAFRVHGDDIVRLINGTQPTANQTVAV